VLQVHIVTLGLWLCNKSTTNTTHQSYFGPQIIVNSRSIKKTIILTPVDTKHIAAYVKKVNASYY